MYATNKQLTKLKRLETMETNLDNALLAAIMEAEGTGYTTSNQRQIDDAVIKHGKAAQRLFDFCVALEKEQLASIPGGDTIL